ncbi:hypothetical protein BpHYR1_019758 [Brachionus plicatilis]|uniref:Uncharacterized protein n=1 Tax=Brachionus plicatilis TaxID=10195 RepID=A0A3M7PPG5_BRAPC|nr:hypothetical protein BpHYR1_019758 [Brachionus plicatilis]
MLIRIKGIALKSLTLSRLIKVLRNLKNELTSELNDIYQKLTYKFYDEKLWRISFLYLWLKTLQLICKIQKIVNLAYQKNPTRQQCEILNNFCTIIFTFCTVIFVPKFHIADSTLNGGTEDASVTKIYRTCFGPSKLKL